MSEFFPKGTTSWSDDPVRPDSGRGSWRDQKVEDPFDDPKVRQRIAELIIRAVAKPERFGV